VTKRVFLMGGLAILAVVSNHAAGYGQVALFLWADRYRPVSVPCWSALGSPSHYVLMIVKSIGVFAVPAFLFIAGFFSVYIAGGDLSSGQQWRAVLRRVLSLSIPYVVWSVVIFVGDAVQGTIYEPLEYVAKLLATGASAHLYYVPLLCSCYLLSPWVVAAARKRPRLLLVVLALVQTGALSVQYLRRFGITSPALVWMLQITPGWSLPWWLIYFCLGIVTALNVQRAKELLSRCRWPIVAVAVAAWVSNILETDYLLQTFRTDWVAGIDTISYNLFAVSVLACFLAFADVRVPWSKALLELGKRSYGVYLVHVPVIDVVARVIRRLAPGMLAYQLALVPLLFVVGLAVPLLLMKAVRRCPPMRRAYPYLFG